MRGLKVCGSKVFGIKGDSDSVGFRRCGPVVCRVLKVSLWFAGYFLCWEGKVGIC